MLGNYDLVGSFKKVLSISDSSKLSSFHLFPLLPPELRHKIFMLALPERIIEVSICRRDNMWQYFSITPEKRLDCRKIPELFSVNVESREFCLSQYVLFAHNYIHPRLDILYISWHKITEHRSLILRTHFTSRFTSIKDRPFEKFHNVIITAAQNRQFDARFGALIECFKSLGSPKEVTLGLDGPKLPHMFSDTRGFSASTGHQVIALTWLTDTETTIPEHPEQSEPDQVKPKTLQEEVAAAFRIEEEVSHDLRLPKVKEQMVYIYSGP